jgi:hypothetical protein
MLDLIEAAAAGPPPPAAGGRVRYLTTGPLEPFRAALLEIVGEPGPRDAVVALAPALRSV